MDSLEDWLQASPKSVPSVVAKWATKLIELGASWETFQGDNNATLDDLVDGGIPRLSARDICRSMSEVLQRRSRPLIVLWDMENVCIPAQTSASLCVTRIKEAVAQYGQIEQFRAYVDIDQIPEQRRSVLQQTGCKLVDLTNNSQKEVADKMIIVDSLEFAYMHPEGAAICFITADVDYAYLFTKLQKPQWTTIVVSSRSSSMMLHVNCSVNMRWETDVLQMPMSQEMVASKTSSTSSSTPLPLSAPPLTLSDKVLLYSIISEGSHVGDSLPGTRKSYVGQMLKERQPIRFADRNVVKSFLAQAIESGIVFETGDGAFKSLHTTSEPGTTMVITPKIPLSARDISPKILDVSKALPYMVFVEKQHVPKGTGMPGFVQQAGNYLVLMFKGKEEASHTVETALQSKGIMIHRDDLLSSVQRAITDAEEKNVIALIAQHGEISLSNLKATYKASYGADILCENRLRDYLATSRKIQVKKRFGDDSNDWVACLCPPPGIGTKPMYPEATKCGRCTLLTPRTDLFLGSTEGEQIVLCQICYTNFSSGWTAEERAQAQRRVVHALNMMAEYDDILLPRNILRKILLEMFPSHCYSRSQASLWIDHSIEAGIVLEMKHCDDKKNKRILLPEYERFVDVPYPVGVDTLEAEQFVTDLLWDSGGVMDRKQVNHALTEKFPTKMAHRMMRAMVMINARSSGAFFVAKGPRGQAIGLTYEDAKVALNQMISPSASGFEDASREVESKDDDKNTFSSFKESARPDGQPPDFSVPLDEKMAVNVHTKRETRNGDMETLLSVDGKRIVCCEEMKDGVGGNADRDCREVDDEGTSSSSSFRSCYEDEEDEEDIALLLLRK